MNKIEPNGYAIPKVVDIHIYIHVCLIHMRVCVTDIIDIAVILLRKVDFLGNQVILNVQLYGNLILEKLLFQISLNLNFTSFAYVK